MKPRTLTLDTYRLPPTQRERQRCCSHSVRLKLERTNQTRLRKLPRKLCRFSRKAASMRKHACWRAMFRWSAVNSTKRAKLLWVSPCSTTIPLSLRARCRRPCSLISAPEKRMKRTGRLGNCTKNIPITQADLRAEQREAPSGREGRRDDNASVTAEVESPGYRLTMAREISWDL